MNMTKGLALRRLIEHSYTSCLKVDSELALDMFETSDMLQFEELRFFCEDFLVGEVLVKSSLIIFF